MLVLSNDKINEKAFCYQQIDSSANLFSSNAALFTLGIMLTASVAACGILFVFLFIVEVKVTALKLHFLSLSQIKWCLKSFDYILFRNVCIMGYAHAHMNASW